MTLFSVHGTLQVVQISCAGRRSRQIRQPAAQTKMRELRQRTRYACFVPMMRKIKNNREFPLIHRFLPSDIFRVQNGISLHTSAPCDISRVHQRLILPTREFKNRITCAPEANSAHESPLEPHHVCTRSAFCTRKGNVDINGW